jgi:hypothetical protein
MSWESKCCHLPPLLRGSLGVIGKVIPYLERLSIFGLLFYGQENSCTSNLGAGSFNLLAIGIIIRLKTATLDLKVLEILGHLFW